MMVFAIMIFPLNIFSSQSGSKPKLRKKRKSERKININNMVKFLLTIVILSMPSCTSAARGIHSADYQFHLSQLEAPLEDLSNQSSQDEKYEELTSESESISSLSSQSSSPSMSEEEEDLLRTNEKFPGINVPTPGNLDDSELRILSLNTDGCKDWEGILKQAKKRGIQALCLVDSERPSNHGPTSYLLKQKFAHDCTISITQGLSQLFTNSSLGGTVSAVGKGWGQRCTGFSEDKYGWGRYSVMKMNGSSTRAIWILSMYAPYNNKDSPESYYNMLLHRMKDYETRTSKRLARTPDGDLCPTLQLRDELGEILREARSKGAELVLTGDFNERWEASGIFRQWAEANNLCNVLDPDEITGGATTCFPSSGPPTDIDWVLSTPGLYTAGMIKAGVLHSKIVATAHCPIFVTIKALKWLKLQKSDIPKYARHKYPQNFITGDSDSPRIATYQKLLCKNWSKFKVPTLKAAAEKAIDSFEEAKIANADSSLCENLQKHAETDLQVAYSAVIGAFNKTMHQMSARYATGKKRLTFFSKEMLECRRMRSRAWRLEAMWEKFKAQSGHIFDDGAPRGKNRGGNRRGRGVNPKIMELKHRLTRWFERTGKINPELAQSYDSVVISISNLSVSRDCTARELRRWDSAFTVMKKMIQKLDYILQSKHRKDMVHEAQDKAVKCKKRGIKQIIRNLSIPKPNSGAINRIEIDGEIISDPAEISVRLVAFWDAWFGNGRKNRWNCNQDGSSAHPLCDRTERAKILCQALIDGKYSEVAFAEEKLPDVVQKMYDLGLFSRKIITTGPLAGQQISTAEMATLRAPPTTVEWRNAKSKLKKCTHPGKDKVTKPALFHCPYHLYMELGQLIFMAETNDIIFEQHRQVQMWLIPKDAGKQNIERLRPLWFESEILKLQEHIMEGRVDALCKKFGILEKEQSGFEKGKDCGTAIFPVSQLIEDSRIANRELWIAFLDQAKAFDTLESFQGKLMASLVLGLPFEYANKKVKFDESVIAEIITAHGTSWEILGFKKGTFIPQCGGLQGGPRSPGMWKRFYDILIRAQKLVKDGKLAYIVSEDGEKITLTSKVYADDTVLFSGDNLNFKARAKMQQLLVDYSGSNVKPPKCIITAIIHELDGKTLRHVETHENIGFTDLNDKTHQLCTTIGPTDPFRYLGWFSCVSIAIDQAYITMMKRSQAEVDYIYTVRCTGKELTTYVNVKSLPRILWEMRYSTTGEKSLTRLQKLYNKLFRTKAKLIGGFPNLLMYAKEKAFGLGFVNFWDAVSIDRIVTYLKHSFGEKEESSIFAAAVMRSENLQQSNLPCLECSVQRPWDGTVLGRVKEWLASHDYKIVGGKTNFGHKVNDIAILDLVENAADMKMIIAGCQKSGIWWKSQCTADDGNTWIADLQHNGKFTRKHDKFVWFNFREDYKTGERMHIRKENLWSLWWGKIKKLLQAQHAHSQKLGKYFQGALPPFAPLDVFLTPDSKLPKLVVKQIDETVHYIQCNLPRSLKTTLGRSASYDAQGYRWENTSLGLSSGSYFAGNGKLFTTPWAAIKKLDRKSAIKVSAQIIPIRIGAREFRNAELSDGLNEQATFSKLGGLFLRFVEHQDQKVQHMIWNNTQVNLEKFRLPNYLENCASLQQFIGEGNAGYRGKPMTQLFTRWRVQASLHKKGGIIAGGDGSAKLLPEGQEGAFAWVVMAIGPLSLAHLSIQPAKYVKILASGGSADWTIRKFRTNTRAEKLHVLAAMIALLPAGLNVWYFVDYSGAISTAIDVQTWIASDWLLCEDRDILSAILFMQGLYEKQGLYFKLLKIKAHPENWCCLPVEKYKAIHQMAVIQDTAAKAVFARCHGTGIRPFLPGQFRWHLTHKGQEVVGPIRSYLKNNIGINYTKQHINGRKHNGNLHLASKATEWSPLNSWASSCWTGYSAMSNCKYLFHRWATLSFQVRTGILQQSDENEHAADTCSCGEIENMWHILSSGVCSGFPNIRRRFSARRVEMMKELELSADAIVSFVSNAEVKADGTYPDWNDEADVALHFNELENVTTKYLQTGKGYWSHWFQRGPLPCGLIENSKAALGVNSKQAEKFARRWFESKRAEAADLWERRNNLKHKSNEANFALLGELRLKLRNLILDRRKNGLHTHSNSYYIKLHRNQLKRFLSQYELEAAQVLESQPTILDTFIQNGLDVNAASSFATFTDTQNSMAAARQQSLSRRKRKAASATSNCRCIDTIFDQDDDQDSQIIDASDSSTEAIEMVSNFMHNATMEDNFDEGAMLDINAQVESMLLNDKEDWEL